MSKKKRRKLRLLFTLWKNLVKINEDFANKMTFLLDASVVPNWQQCFDYGYDLVVETKRLFCKMIKFDSEQIMF